MAAADQPLTGLAATAEEAKLLSQQWRRLIRSATLVALVMSPAVFVWLHSYKGMSLGWSLFWTFTAVVAFRGFMDIAMRRLIPWPRLFGVEDAGLREDDVVDRRRAWFWLWVFRWVVRIGVVLTVFWLLRLLLGHSETWWDSVVVIKTWFAANGRQFVQ